MNEPQPVNDYAAFRARELLSEAQKSLWCAMFYVRTAAVGISESELKQTIKLVETLQKGIISPAESDVQAASERKRLAESVPHSRRARIERRRQEQTIWVIVESDVDQDDAIGHVKDYARQYPEHEWRVVDSAGALIWPTV